MMIGELDQPAKDAVHITLAYADVVASLRLAAIVTNAVRDEGGSVTIFAAGNGRREQHEIVKTLDSAGLFFTKVVFGVQSQGTR